MEEFIIKYWLEVLFGLICAIFSFLFKKIMKRQEEEKKKREEEEKKRKALENGVQALLRNELIKNFREYKIKDEITLLDKENMDHMFIEYFNLGGNGMMQEVHEEFTKIPIKVIK